MEREQKEGVPFLRRWSATLAFIILFLSQTYVTFEIFEQNEDIEELVREESTHDCLRRQVGRESIREVFKALVDFTTSQHPNGEVNPHQEEQVRVFLEYLDTNYPPITCPDRPTAER